MVNVIMKNEIITRFRNNESQRSIAKTLACSRNTVSKYIKEYLKHEAELKNESDPAKIALIQREICSPPKLKSHRRKRMAFTDLVEKRFNEIINMDEERDELLGRNKQSLTATLLHKTLIEEGYNVSLTTICNEYRRYKNKPKECFIKQEYDYGQRAEFDFHQIKVLINQKYRKYYQATITLPKSGIVFGSLYNNETFNSVNDSIIKFFNYIGGVTEEMVFDNMSTVVKRFLDKGKKQYTNNIRSLSTYYGFKIITTNPRRGNEKGHVEVSGKIIRKNLFSLKYKFNSENELMEYFKRGIEELNKDNLEELEKERLYLNELPAKELFLYEISSNKVSPYSLIRVLNNFYSVPDKYVGKDVDTHLYPDKLVIYYKNMKIAEHIKKEGLKEYSLKLDHYLATFLKKPGALKNSLVLKQTPKVLQTIFYDDYNMDAKRFLDFIMNNETIEKELVTVNDVSINQLESYSQLFEIGDITT